MTYRIGKKFTFAAAHRLPGLPPDHKCSRLHGHSYTVEVVLTSEQLEPPGFVTDFGDLEPFGNYIDDTLDHRDLNQVLDVAPTSEAIAKHLAEWYVNYLEPLVSGRLMSVRVWESPTSWAEFVIGDR